MLHHIEDVVVIAVAARQVVLTQVLRDDHFDTLLEVHHEEVLDDIDTPAKRFDIPRARDELHVDHHIQGVVLDLLYLLFKLVGDELPNVLVLEHSSFLA